jgi:hypothetical protein
MSEPSKKSEYHKPVVMRIELSTEEVMAVSCKTASGSSTAVAGARPCRISPCSTIGS